MLAAPSAGSNDNMLQDAVTAATNRGLVRPNDHVVCVMSIKDSLVVKVVTMDGIGARCMRHTNSAQGVNHDSSTSHSTHIHTHKRAVGAVVCYPCTVLLLIEASPLLFALLSTM